MQIDIPEQAIAIWTDGDKLVLSIPGNMRQLIDIPVQAPMTMLLNILQPRERAVRSANGHKMTIGTECAPVQYDIDKIAAAFANKTVERESRALDAERERKRLLRKDAKMQARKEADELLSLCGLT